MKIYVGMAHCAGREKALYEAVESILDGSLSVSKIFVCPDRTEVPHRVVALNDKIVEAVDPPKDNLGGSLSKGDANKLWPLNVVEKRLGKSPARYVYVTADDDLLYPSDFIRDLCRGLSRHPGAVVSNHGGRLLLPVTNYYGSFTERFPCHLKRETDENVHIVGTGCAAAINTTWRLKLGYRWPDIHERNMLDIWIGRMAQRRAVPLWVTAHDPVVMSPHLDHARDTIYGDTILDQRRMSLIAKIINDEGEWSLHDDDGRPRQFPE